MPKTKIPKSEENASEKMTLDLLQKAIEQFSRFSPEASLDEVVEAIRERCNDLFNVWDTRYIPPEEVRDYFKERPDLYSCIRSFKFFSDNSRTYWVARQGNVTEGQNLGVFHIPNQAVRYTPEAYKTLLLHLSAQSGVILGSAEALDKARRSAQYDGLTGLLRKERFMELLQEQFKQAYGREEPLSLLIADLDDFKLYNDSYGHDAGDLALKRASSVLSSSLRKTDESGRYGQESEENCSGRFGGEEFCVLLPHTKLNGAKVVGERIRQEVASIDDLKERITCSIGIANFPEHAPKTIEELFSFADQALYQAKRQGKNRVVVYSPTISAQA